MERYRMRTSQGAVTILFDPDGFETVTWETRDNYGEPDGGHVSERRNTKFTIESGGEFITKLYDGWLSHILKTESEELFAMIELSDGYYGSPEYMLEKVE